MDAVDLSDWREPSMSLSTSSDEDVPMLKGNSPPAYYRLTGRPHTCRYVKQKALDHYKAANAAWRAANPIEAARRAAVLRRETPPQPKQRPRSTRNRSSPRPASSTAASASAPSTPLMQPPPPQPSSTAASASAASTTLHGVMTVEEMWHKWPDRDWIPPNSGNDEDTYLSAAAPSTPLMPPPLPKPWSTAVSAAAPSKQTMFSPTLWMPPAPAPPSSPIGPPAPEARPPLGPRLVPARVRPQLPPRPRVLQPRFAKEAPPPPPPTSRSPRPRVLRPRFAKEAPPPPLPG